MAKNSIKQQWEAAVKATNIDTVKPRLSLKDFVIESWQVTEPSTDLLWNWHIDAMCLHIQETLLDWYKHKQNPHYVQRIQNLLINVPPGSLKSRVLSVCTPAWFWTICPSWRAIFLSANPRVALRDSVYCRDIIESDWYQSRFSPDWSLRDDNNSKSSFWNTKGGTRSAFGFNSRITGDRGDFIAWDDPHDAQEVNSDAIRRGVIDRWDSAIRNRVNDPKSSVRMGIMQRLHTEDLAGHVLKQGGWEHLCIPQEFEATQPITSLGWADPRQQAGELMFPERFSLEVLAAEKIALGSYGYAGQHQQLPAPADGGHFKRSWWQYYKVPPEDFDIIIQSWDCAFKETKISDYVVGQVWGKKGGQFYLLDQVRDRMDINATINAIRALSAKYPNSTAKLIEDKANGSAIISLLNREISGLIAIEPQGGKIVRAVACSPLIEAGNVFLPYPSIASWINDYVEEFSIFPNGSNDDQVDSSSQSLNWLMSRINAWRVSHDNIWTS